MTKKGSYAEPSVLGTVKFDGKVWGLPRAFSTKALYYNKALLAEAGLDMADRPARPSMTLMTRLPRPSVEKTDGAMASAWPPPISTTPCTSS